MLLRHAFIFPVVAKQHLGLRLRGEQEFQPYRISDSVDGGRKGVSERGRAGWKFGTGGFGGGFFFFQNCGGLGWQQRA